MLGQSHLTALRTHCVPNLRANQQLQREKPEQKWGTRQRKEMERRELWVRVELLWFMQSPPSLSTSSWCFLSALDQAFFWCLCEKFDAHREKMNSCMHYVHEDTQTHEAGVIFMVLHFRMKLSQIANFTFDLLVVYSSVYSFTSVVLSCTSEHTC